MSALYNTIFGSDLDNKLTLGQAIKLLEGRGLIDIGEVAKHIEDHKSDYPEAIKHDVTKRWNEWSRSNSFYKLDNDQIIPVNGVQGYGPLQTISKTRIVQMYREMGLDELLAQTTSCHIGPQYPTPCGFCISEKIWPNRGLCKWHSESTDKEFFRPGVRQKSRLRLDYFAKQISVRPQQRDLWWVDVS